MGTEFALSVIIAMYNSEKYIRKCIDSILESNLPKDSYEIIVVNDGSKDGSVAIVEEYQQHYPNVHLYHQENQGQSVARNHGLKYAKGEYIWFVDSDDYVEADLQPVYQAIQTNEGLDIVGIRSKVLDEEGKQLYLYEIDNFDANTVLSGKEALLKGYQPSSMWANIIRKGFLLDNKLEFYPGILHQDTELSLRCMLQAKKVFYTGSYLYDYIIHEGSSVHPRTMEKLKKSVLDNITVMNSIRNLSLQYKNDPEMGIYLKNRFDSSLFGFMVELTRNYFAWKPIRKAVVEKLKENSMLPMKIGDAPLRKKPFMLFMNLIFSL